jgi:hypothetical protein
MATDKQLDQQDGLSQEELDQQEVAELPNREAMSVVNPHPGMPADDGMAHILPYPYDPGQTEPAPDDGTAHILPYPYEPQPEPSPEPGEYTLPYEPPA